MVGDPRGALLPPPQISPIYMGLSRSDADQWRIFTATLVLRGSSFPFSESERELFSFIFVAAHCEH